MKDKKYCDTTAQCWGYRHELIGLVLLVLATILTVVTFSSLGIVAMFIVGLVMCCHKHLGRHCCDCHCGDNSSELKMPMVKHDKMPVKKSLKKVKTKV